MFDKIVNNGKTLEFHIIEKEAVFLAHVFENGKKIYSTDFLKRPFFSRLQDAERFIKLFKKANNILNFEQKGSELIAEISFQTADFEFYINIERFDKYGEPIEDRYKFIPKFNNSVYPQSFEYSMNSSIEDAKNTFQKMIDNYLSQF